MTDVANMSAYEAQELEREALKWQRGDDIAGRPHRTIEQIKGEILTARRNDRIRQIRLAREKLSDWLWAIEQGMEDSETVFRAEAERRLEPLLSDSPYLEWGAEFVIPATDQMPEHIVVYPEDSQGSAERTINEDRAASGSPTPRGRVMYRRAAGPWKEAPRAY